MDLSKTGLEKGGKKLERLLPFLSMGQSCLGKLPSNDTPQPETAVENLIGSCQRGGTAG